MTIKETLPTDPKRGTVESVINDQPAASDDRGRVPGDYFDRMLVNSPRVLQVVVSKRALADALTNYALSRAFEAVQKPQGDLMDLIEDLLSAQGLIDAGPDAIAATRFGRSLLIDQMGNSANRMLERTLTQEGIGAALHRLGDLQTQHLGQARLRSCAEQAAQSILNGLDSLWSFRSHLDCLLQIQGRLGPLAERIRQRQMACGQQVANLDRQLRQRAAAAAGEPQSPRFQRLKAIGQRVAALVGRSGSNGSSLGRDGESHLGRTILEVDRIRFGLQLAVLDAEGLFMTALSNLVTGEIERDQEALTALAIEQDSALKRADEAESCRDYGIAASEILLGDRRLTDAILRHIWQTDSEDGIGRFLHRRFNEAHQGQSLLALSGGELTADVLTEFTEAARCAILDEVERLTIVDALVALAASCDIQNKLAEAFKQTVTLDLLGPNNAINLVPQTFAALAFKPSASPQTSQVFDELLRPVLDSLPLTVTVSEDVADAQALTFYCEYFCLPLTATFFFEESYDDFLEVCEDPRYNPHPELHG